MGDRKPSFVAQARPAPFTLEGDAGGGAVDDDAVDEAEEAMSPRRLARRSSERRLMESDFNPLADDINGVSFDNPLAGEA